MNLVLLEIVVALSLATGEKNGLNKNGKIRCEHGKEYSSEKDACVPMIGGTPICDPPCENGECSSSDECTCLDGFNKTAKPHVCAPFCDTPCINSTCVKNGVCECWKGYSKYGRDGFGCQPLCTRCRPDLCVAPDICRCPSGYSDLEQYVKINNIKVGGEDMSNVDSMVISTCVKQQSNNTNKTNNNKDKSDADFLQKAEILPHGFMIVVVLLLLTLVLSITAISMVCSRNRRRHTVSNNGRSTPEESERMRMSDLEDVQLGDARA